MSEDMDSQQIQELIERLEKLDGPDHEIDLDIRALLFGCKRDKYRPGGLIEPNSTYVVFNTPEYTSSIGAALTLVPDRWEWQIDNCMASTEEQTVYTAELGETIKVEHVSLPHAIIIASLRARM